MSSLQEKYKDHFILFIEAGFIAVNQMDEASALRLFHAAKLINPHALINDLGMGYFHLCRLEITKCLEHLDRILKQEPHNEIALAFKAMALTMSTDKVKEGHKLLEELKRSHNKDVEQFSHQGLEFIEKYVKKTTAK
jgi:hydroxymethylpyrimidine pyrophosphatase-like HAD family hydrolase